MPLRHLPTPPAQLRHAADLLEAAKSSSSKAEALALLGTVREICQRAVAEITSVLDPQSELVRDVVERVRRGDKA